MENYIVINGKKAELTEEQLKALGIEVSKANAFDRREKGEWYYYINFQGEVVRTHETNSSYNENMYNAANYCADKTLMEQRTLHETLDRLLWRFSMMNGGDKIDWNDFGSLKYAIFYDYRMKEFAVSGSYWVNSFRPYFWTEKIAKQAIEEIIKPFIAAHPEFDLTL